MINEHRQVVLTQDLPSLNLKQGDLGVVIYVHNEGEAYEVEFMTLEGLTIGIETLPGHAVRAVLRSEVPHVRDRLAA